jgi:hypothetical protein
MATAMLIISVKISVCSLFTSFASFASFVLFAPLHHCTIAPLHHCNIAIFIPKFTKPLNTSRKEIQVKEREIKIIIKI